MTLLPMDYLLYAFDAVIKLCNWILSRYKNIDESLVISSTDGL